MDFQRNILRIFLIFSFRVVLVSNLGETKRTDIGKIEFGNPPVVGAQIKAPVPENEAQFGEAMWVKVFTTEIGDAVKLEDLIGGNALIEQAKQHTEIEWQLLQTDPGNPLAGLLESGYGAPVGPNAGSIIRRYEFYKYSGEYDPETHEALVGSDSHPSDTELGIYIGAQNAAVNLNAAAAVPEPETYTLMLAGLAMLGFIKRRGSSAAG